jgi:TIR domain
MADIFISYKKEDAGRVVRLVEALRGEGFSVWWDHGIAPGSQWDQTIQTELRAAKVVMAIWSEQSVNAPWVKEEAGVGKNRGVLLPVQIDRVEPPLGFSLIQAADLVGWDGDPKDAHFQHVLGAVRAIVRGEQPTGLEAPRRRARTPFGLIAGVLVAAIVGVAAAAYLLGAVPGGPAPVAVGPSAPSVPGQAVPATAVDQEMFSRARESGAKSDYQDYLAAYPNGAYANQVRDILLRCRVETREAWQPGQSAQPVRGVSVQPDQTQEQACAEASRMANTQADRNCAAIAGNIGFRNGVATVQPAACDCTQASYGWSCTIDMAASCTWEQRQMQPVDVCR